MGMNVGIQFVGGVRHLALLLTVFTLSACGGGGSGGPEGDTTPPDTTISASPASQSNVADVSFEFTATEAGSSFECSLDAGSFVDCTSPQAYLGLSEGAHIFSVRATDAAGNTDTSAATHKWQIDQTAPDTSISSNPDSLTNTTSASFSFDATEAGASFQCSMDGGAFADCASPKAYSGLSEDTHTFQVRATDRAGNADVSAASYSWQIDLTPPNTNVVSGPANPTLLTSASFVFSATEAGSSFRCSLDGGTFAACVSPKAYAGLSVGNHAFRVRATDAAGNADSSPADYNWQIAISAPETSISSGPDSRTNSAAATFAFTSTESGATFQCSMDGSGYASCASPKTYTGLAEGNHSFAVRAVGATGSADPSPATRSWNIDLTPPNTVVSSGPANPTNSDSASFVFASTESGSSFQCSLDGGSYADCSSPKSYAGQAEGSHIFTVRATDAVGNMDATPAAYSWDIDVTPPDTSITTSPVDPTNSTAATFVFTATETGSTFQCSLDGAVFANCASPKTYTGVAEGNHTFSVQAVDAAGNTDASAAQYSWDVDTTPPDTSITTSPADPTNSLTASFAFTSTEAGSVFQCAVDGGAYADCSSPKAYASLLEGAHDFSVRATDNAGNVDQTAATFSWTIDSTPPVVTVPVGITLVSTGLCGVLATNSDIQTFLAGATATDNIDGDVTAGIADDAPTCFPIGTTTVVFSVSDAAGNAGSNSSTVDVIAVDNVKPATTSILLNRNAQYAVAVNELSARISASDNVGITGYLITEHNATDPLNVLPPYADPLPSDGGWVPVTATTSFNTTTPFSLLQTYNMGDIVELCVWFKDEQGNISDRVCDSIVYGVDWESGWGNWYADNGVWEVGGPPTAGPGACYSGTECAGTVLDGNYPNTDSNLVMPSIILPSITAGEEIQLRFWHWFSLATRTYSGGTNDSGRIYIQEETSPGVWSAATELASYVGNSGGVWTRPMVDLSAYAGQKVRLLFGLVNGGYSDVSSGWYIDDISVAVVQADNSLPYSDDFESGLGNWWASNGTWEVGGLPTAGPAECYNSSAQCAATVLDSNYPNSNSNLVSPAITLPAIVAGEEIQLRFWHWFSLATRTYSGGTNDSGRIYIQEETSPGVWSAATELASYVGNSGGVWTRPMVDLSAYAGQKVRLLLGLVNGGYSDVSSGWYIDDVTITVY